MFKPNLYDETSHHQAQNAILPLWKVRGASTHRLAQSAARHFGVKCAHTGILDPLAEGVVVLLLGQARFQRSFYTQQAKTYRAEVCVGLSSDSLDLLGLVDDDYQSYIGSKGSNGSIAQLQRQLDDQKKMWTGEIQQTPPMISSVKVQGKRSQYWYKKQQRILDIPSRTVHVYQLKMISIDLVSYQNIIQRALQQIPLVQGVFRQQECIDRWQAHSYSTRGEQNQITSHQQFMVLTFEATVGAGCYIRSLAKDWLLSCGMKQSLVIDLIRTHNAGFESHDCDQLIPLPSS